MSTAMNEAPQIRVFYLNDPLLWIANEKLIKSTLITAMQLNVQGQDAGMVNSQIDFGIDTLCGHIHCYMNHDLWYKNVKTGVEKLSLDLVKTNANAFIKRIIVQCNTPEYKKANIAPILPGQYARAILQDTFLVPHPTKNWIDHWICRFLVFVDPVSKEVTQTGADGKNLITITPKDSVPVYGSNIDVRIGKNGSIAGFESYWRPTNMELKEVPVTALDEAAFAAAGGSDANGQKNPIKPQLVYLLDGAQSPQNIMSPYYMKQVEDDSFFLSASDRSLTINFKQENKDDLSAILTATAAGGSGEYVYQWSGYNHAEVWDEKVKLMPGVNTDYDKENNLPATTQIRVEPGVFNMILLVADTQTGVIKQQQYTVYTTPDTTQDIPPAS